MRIREPKTTALIFASGKMVVTGAKSEDDSKLASRKYARIIQKLGFNAKFTDFKIQNIVGSCDVKFPIRLEGLASKHHHFSSYEPELFPGLIYRMMQPKIVLLIFVSGKIVLTGAKVREEIYRAFETIYPVLNGMFIVPIPPLALFRKVDDTDICDYRLPEGLVHYRQVIHRSMKMACSCTIITPNIISYDITNTLHNSPARSKNTSLALIVLLIPSLPTITHVSASPWLTTTVRQDLEPLQKHTTKACYHGVSEGRLHARNLGVCSIYQIRRFQ